MECVNIPEMLLDVMKERSREQSRNVIATLEKIAQKEPNKREFCEQVVESIRKSFSSNLAEQTEGAAQLRLIQPLVIKLIETSDI